MVKKKLSTHKGKQKLVTIFFLSKHKGKKNGYSSVRKDRLITFASFYDFCEGGKISTRRRRRRRRITVLYTGIPKDQPEPHDDAHVICHLSASNFGHQGIKSVFWL